MRAIRWPRRLLPSLLLLLLPLGLAGCSGVGKMPVQFDDYARRLEPPAEQALVYVVRPSNAGKIMRFTVQCDGDSIGATGGKRYIYTLQPPGAHVFVSRAENKSELPIVLEAGQTYYLEQKIKMGIFSARANLERIPDAEGREKLAKCALSEEIVAPIPGSEAYMQQLRAEKRERAERRQEGDRTR